MLYRRLDRVAAGLSVSPAVLVESSVLKYWGGVPPAGGRAVMEARFMPPLRDAGRLRLGSETGVG